MENNMLNPLQPDAERITPVEHQPTHDYAPEELALETPIWLKDDLIEMLGEGQVHSRVIDLVKYATDASPYRMFPKVVVTPKSRSLPIFYTSTRKTPCPCRPDGPDAHHHRRASQSVHRSGGRRASPPRESLYPPGFCL